MGFSEEFKTKDDEEKGFEVSADFLYKNFIPRRTAICESVRELDVLFPIGEKFRVKDGVVDNFETFCEWEELTKFLDRVASTFPNVRYQVVEERRGKLRQAEIAEWRETGVRLELLKKGDYPEGEEYLKEYLGEIKDL